MDRLTKLALLGAVTLLPMLTQAQWSEATSRHFVIYSEENPEQLREFAEKLERFDQAMRQINLFQDPDLGPANRLTVYVVGNLDAVQRSANVGTSMAGLYVGRAGGSLAVVPRRRVGSGQFDLDAQTVLFHEYAHHFLYSNFAPVAWPIWLSEAYAEFHSTAEIRKDGAVDLGLPALRRADSLTSLPKIPIERMLSNAYPGQIETPSMYARAWLLMHHLTFEPSRKGQLGKYLSALSRGTTSVAAGSNAFGDLEQLDRDLDRDVGKRVTYLRLPGSAIKIDTITLRALTPGEDAILPLRIRFKLGVEAEQAQELLPQVRQAAKPFGDDAIAQVAVAGAEFDARNYSEAEAAADRAIAANSKLVDALVYKGRARMALAQKAQDTRPATWQDVRKWFAMANRLDPDHPGPLILSYRSFSASGQTPSANSVVGLKRAHELAPQDRNLQMLTAFQYLVEGKATEARILLTLVACDPHAGTQATTAAGILDQLDQAGASAALELFKQVDLTW